MLMEFLTFAFQDFWHFAGCLMMLGVIVTPFHTAMTIIAARLR